MRKFKYIAMLFFFCAMWGVMESCSSSGGGGDTPDLVLVTSDNAEALAREAYMGRGAMDMDEIMGEGDSMFDNLDSLLGDSDVSLDELAAMGSGKYTMEGSCDGAATISFSFEGTTSASATVVFDQFNDSFGNCDDGPVIDGKIKGSANYTYDEQADTIDLNSAKLTCSDTSVIYAGDEYLMDGTIEYKNSDSDGQSVKINASVSYVNENYSVDLIGYVDRFSYDDATGTTTENVSGIIESSENGAVRISTEVSVVTRDVDGYPSSGTIVITGAATDLGNSSAKLEFGANGTFMVSCDEDGDGVYESNSGALTW